MPRRQHVVIVAQNPALAAALLSWLGSAGYELTIVMTYAAAKAVLNTGPALIISEVKLREYNGLHLALKARASGIPAIVIGPEDAVLRKDANELGAVYLTSVLRRRHVLELVRERLNVTPGHAIDSDLVWQFDQASWFAGISPSRRLLH